jgi:hypothetical protein
MKKRFLSMLLVVVLCFCAFAYAEEETATDFRSIPGYTCFPLVADNPETPGHFCVDCPMEWTGGDASEGYGVPTAFAADPNNLSHSVVITELGTLDQAIILLDDEHPLGGFLREGLNVIKGESTENSKILEQFDLHGLPATRVEMVGQGFEMIWISNPDEECYLLDWGIEGDLWYFMYPVDPDDKEYTQIVSGMVDSFTTTGIYTSIPCSIKEAPASDFIYTIDQDEVCIEAYTGEKEYVIVPDEIEGKPVTSMGNNAFYEKTVRCVTLPDSIREMGHHTFGGCAHLVYASMPESLEVLPDATFESCFRLRDPGLCDGLKKIEQTAFWGNNYLTELYLPETLEEIEDDAFAFCSYLGYITVPEENKHFQGNDDGTILLSADGEKLIWYSFMNEDKEYSVPGSVKQIYSGAFRRASLTGVTLPDGLEYIGYAAFENTGITELHIPASVTQIGIMQNVQIGEGTELTTAEYISIGESIKTIYGVPGSAAEKYAEIQHLTFVPEE